MKKLSLLFVFLLISFAAVQAESPQKDRGAVKSQELGQAVFSALQQNQFNNLHSYLPNDADLQILKRRSSEDMRLVLERTTADSIKNDLQRSFANISEQTTSNAFNWSEWQLTNTKATRRDRRNPLLYSLEMTLTNAVGTENTIMAEAVRIRGRYFLFRQLVFKGEK